MHTRGRELAGTVPWAFPTASEGLFPQRGTASLELTCPLFFWSFWSRLNHCLKIVAFAHPGAQWLRQASGGETGTAVKGIAALQVGMWGDKVSLELFLLVSLLISSHHGTLTVSPFHLETPVDKPEPGSKETGGFCRIPTVS